MAEIKPTNEAHSIEIPVTEVPSQSIEKRVTPDRHQDVYAWLLDQAKRLRHYQPESVDWFGLAEELEIIVALERAKVLSLLGIVQAHMLKWQYSKIRRSERSWRNTLAAARTELIDILDESRVLRNEVPRFLIKAFGQALRLAGTQMGLEKHDWQRLFPSDCPWTLEQVLDQDFLPPIAPTANGRS
jgi:hypothetical protein